MKQHSWNVKEAVYSLLKYNNYYNNNNNLVIYWICTLLDSQWLWVTRNKQRNYNKIIIKFKIKIKDGRPNEVRGSRCSSSKIWVKSGRHPDLRKNTILEDRFSSREEALLESWEMTWFNQRNPECANRTRSNWSGSCQFPDNEALCYVELCK